MNWKRCLALSCRPSDGGRGRVGRRDHVVVQWNCTAFSEHCMQSMQCRRLGSTDSSQSISVVWTMQPARHETQQSPRNRATPRSAVTVCCVPRNDHKAIKAGTIFLLRTIRYDTIRDASLTCARKPTWVGLIYRTETTSKNCKTEKLKSKNRYVRSNSKSLGNLLCRFLSNCLFISYFSFDDIFWL